MMKALCDAAGIAMQFIGGQKKRPGIESGGGIDIGGGRTTYGPSNVPLGFPA
jgi:hypothetical protein